MNESEVVILWEAPKLIKTEFRLYYDAVGAVLFYSCDKPSGNFIVVDSLTYAKGRYDIRVVDGKIVTQQSSKIVTRLVPGNGTSCVSEDISIMAMPDYTGKITKWEMKIYEL